MTSDKDGARCHFWNRVSQYLVYSLLHKICALNS